SSWGRMTAPTSWAYSSTGTGIAVGFTFRTNSRAFRTAWNSSIPIFFLQYPPDSLNELCVIRPARSAKGHTCGGTEFFDRYGRVGQSVFDEARVHLGMGSKIPKHLCLSLRCLQSSDEFRQCFL